MLVMIYEDRPSAFVGVQLAALSLAEHSPDLEVRAIVPGAPDEMVAWAASVPSLELVTSREGIDGGELERRSRPCCCRRSPRATTR